MEIENKELKETADISAPKSDIKDHLGLLLSVFGLSFLAFILVWGTTQVAVQFFPDTLETNVFSLISKSEQFNSIPPDTKEFRIAQEAFDKIKTKAATRDINYKLCYMKTELMNAFALPGGTICITQGLLENVRSEIGLAMVIGHEFGHHEKKHVVKRMSTLLTLQLVFVLVTGSQTDILGGSLLNMFMLADSREQELEADDYGYDVLKEVYGSTEGALEFYEKALEKEGESKWKALATWMETHPDTRKRIERLNGDKVNK